MELQAAFADRTEILDRLEGLEAIAKVKLHCDKCRRVLNVCFAHPDRSHLVFEGSGPVVGKAGQPRPWTATAADDKPGGFGDRLKITCHSRCGRVFTLKMITLVRAYCEAVVAGRPGIRLKP